MSNMSYDDRLAANEVVFREHNRKLLQLVSNSSKKVAAKNSSLQFYCECSSPYCLEQVSIDIATYEDTHRQDKRFVIKPGHEQNKIEKVIDKQPGYSVVEKYEVPPEPEEIQE